MTTTSTEAGADRSAAVPSHFNPHEATFDEVRRLYGAIGDQACPVVHSDALGGFYMLTSYAETRRAAGDWKRYSSAAGVTLPKRPVRSAALEHDPPEHDLWRGLFKEVLNLATYRRFEERIVAITTDLIDRFASRGTADLVAEFAAVLPVLAICEIIGIEDPVRATLAGEIAIELLQGFTEPERYAAAHRRYRAFCAEEIAERRRSPREDFLTRLATQEVTPGHTLSDAEIAALLSGFLSAGHHTTSSLLGSMLHRVTSDTALRDQLVGEPALIAKAVEESLRLDTPLHFFYRQTTGDVEVDGCPIPAGSEVMLNFAAANRDGQAFSCPEEFRLDRQPNAHLGFGFGIHACAGSQLARLESRVAMEALLGRLPDIVGTDESVTVNLLGGVLAMVERLPVRFTAETAGVIASPQPSRSGAPPS
jgi:cytochrome P450